MTRLVLSAFLCGFAAATLVPAAAQTPLWTRQFGTLEIDYSSAVAVDSAGNAYIAGSTMGSLGGPNAGNLDIFLAKYDASGAPLWTRQIGTSAIDYCSGVALDSAGNAYIAGSTSGSIGGPGAGGEDAFLAKYDASGTPLWTRQLGTSTDDQGRGVAVDGAGNAYISGETFGSLGGPNAGNYDAFLAKYDASGTPLWTRQLGTSTEDQGRGVGVDGAGNAYISGSTFGSLGGPSAGGYDPYLAKYDASGVPLWTRQFGTPMYDYGPGLAVDSAGNAYIAGETSGSLGGPYAGSNDAFLAKYDASGAPLWTRQLGTQARDRGSRVAVDSAGNAYIAGDTEGSLGGPSAGSYDAFLAKYDAAGAPLWTRQLGTPAIEYGFGVAVDSAGNAYITGPTAGSLGGPNAGSWDAFLAKYGTNSQTIIASTTTLGPGVVFGGTAANINASDDVYYTLRPGAVLTTAQSPIVLTASYTLPASTAEILRAVVESRASQANIRQTVEAYNFSTGSYQQLNQQILPATSPDTVVEWTLYPPANYIGPGNEVRLRISYKAMGAILVFPWRVFVDEMTVRFTP